MWKFFEIYAIISFASWILSMALCLPKTKWARTMRVVFSIIGSISLAIFIANLWISLERPPLRTLGETRLWYSFFISVIGLLVYLRWKYTLFLLYALGMSILFLTINYFNPDIHSKALMPALISPWFVPHVVVYMIAYAFLGFSCVIGIVGLYKMYKKQEFTEILDIGENIIYIGFGFLTTGLSFGALWAKEAWGHYWTWDPKETWAFITWGVYLVFIHLRIHKPNAYKLHLNYITYGFIILLICWFGINYLPAAQTSVHVYSN